jgi:hypothetical protein
VAQPSKFPSYPLGHTVKIKATFKIDGVLTDPTTTTITVREPDGTQTSLSVTNVSTGIRTAVTLTDQVGWHRVRVTGTGTAAAVMTSQFYVQSTGLT